MLVTPIPTNLRLDMSGDRHTSAVVGSDLYGIAERVRELDPNLMIVFHEDREEPFTVMENCKDGVVRFVARYKELDSRIIDDLRYMLNVPFEERLKKVEREIDKANADLEKPDDEVLDWLASEMRRDMKKYGIVH